MLVMSLKVDPYTAQQLLSFVLCIQALSCTPENVNRRMYHDFKNPSTAANHKCLCVCTALPATNERTDGAI